MKTYRVKVNGKVYEVELEAVSEKAGSVAVEAKPEAKSEPVKATGGQSVNAPIAGKVVAIKVKVGDTIKVGDVVAVVEAMKLENEVVSPFEGEIAEILVTKGQNVKAKDVIITIELENYYYGKIV